MKVFNLKQTCGACPSQWEGILEDGRMIYIRYRWGLLCATASDGPTTDISESINGEVIESKTIDESGWDGFMDTTTMAGHLDMVIMSYDDE